MSNNGKAPQRIQFSSASKSAQSLFCRFWRLTQKRRLIDWNLCRNLNNVFFITLGLNEDESGYSEHLFVIQFSSRWALIVCHVFFYSPSRGFIRIIFCAISISKCFPSLVRKLNQNNFHISSHINFASRRSRKKSRVTWISHKSW